MAGAAFGKARGLLAGVGQLAVPEPVELLLATEQHKLRLLPYRQARHLLV